MNFSVRIPVETDHFGLTVIDAAKALGVSRKTLSMVVNGRAGFSPEMAIRLSIAFDTSAESWLNQQIQFDLWQAENQRSKNGSDVAPGPSGSRTSPG